MVQFLNFCSHELMSLITNVNIGSGNIFINPIIPFPTFFEKQREAEERSWNSYSCWKSPLKFLFNALKHIKVKFIKLNNFFLILETIFQVINRIQEISQFQEIDFHHNDFPVTVIETSTLTKTITIKMQWVFSKNEEVPNLLIFLPSQIFVPIYF